MYKQYDLSLDSPHINYGGMGLENPNLFVSSDNYNMGSGLGAPK